MNKFIAMLALMLSFGASANMETFITTAADYSRYGDDTIYAQYTDAIQQCNGVSTVKDKCISEATDILGSMMMFKKYRATRKAYEDVYKLDPESCETSKTKACDVLTRDSIVANIAVHTATIKITSIESIYGVKWNLSIKK